MSSLPVRDQNHINSTISFINLAKSLPPEWTIEEIKPDYGIDYSIEVWKDNRPVGRTCKIQLKHKSNFEVKGPICSLQIKISTINYLYQSNNSFIVINIENTFGVLRAKEIKEIFLNRILEINDEQKQVTIPFVFPRYFESDHARIFWQDGYCGTKLELLFGGKDYAQGTGMASDYYRSFPSEDDFWKFHTYSFLGYYYAHLSRQNSLIKTLENLFTEEDDWGKAGICSAFNYMGHRSDDTYIFSRHLLDSKFYIFNILGISMLARKRDNTHIKEIDSYFLGSFSHDLRHPLREHDEHLAASFAALDALAFIDSEISNDYLLGSLTGTSGIADYCEKQHIAKIINNKLAGDPSFENIVRTFLSMHKSDLYNKYITYSIDTIVSKIADKTTSHK